MGDRVTGWQTDEAAFASSDALLPWWSVTKTVLAVAALRLAEDGRLDLDAHLEGRGHSVADLLAHRVGLANYTDWNSYHRAVSAGAPAWPDARILKRGGCPWTDLCCGRAVGLLQYGVSFGAAGR